MNETEERNGQQDKVDGQPPVPKQPEPKKDAEPSAPLTVAERKAQMARESQELRAMFVAERDQLNAERADLWERVKVLNAEIANIDDTHVKVTKVVKAAGKPIGATTTKAKK